MCVEGAALPASFPASTRSACKKQLELMALFMCGGCQVYDELDGQCLDRTLDLDEDRRPRSKQEMAQEAAELRQLFPQNQQQ